MDSAAHLTGGEGPVRLRPPPARWSRPAADRAELRPRRVRGRDRGPGEPFGAGQRRTPARPARRPPRRRAGGRQGLAANRGAVGAAAGDVPLELVLAEPLACAVNAVDLADVRLGDDVAIVGAGFMGSLVLKLVLLRGPRRVFVADSRPESLELAAKIGATRTIDV